MYFECISGGTLLKNRLGAKLFTVFVAVFVILSVFTSTALAATVDEKIITPNAVMLLDSDTGVVLYEKNHDKKLPPASTTKILTAIIAVEEANLTDTVKVGSEVGVGGSSMKLKSGYEVTVEDLLYGMILNSGNDAAAAVAVHISGTKQEFAKLMNKRAKELGLTNSYFVNPNGLHDEEHISTAEDMAKLARHAITLPDIMRIAKVSEYTVTAKNGNKKVALPLKNTNKLVYEEKDPNKKKNEYYYKYATGLKTGSTTAAGGCIVATATKGNQNLMVLVFGDATKGGADRWAVCKYLFDFGFENYKNVPISELISEVDTFVTVSGAKNDPDEGRLECAPDLKDSGSWTLEKTLDAKDVTVKIVPSAGLVAPIAKGDVVGKATYYLDEKELYSTNLIAQRDVQSDTGASQGPVSSIPPLDIDGDVNPSDTGGLTWLWLIIPAVLIAFIITYYFMNRRRHRMRRYRPHRSRMSYRRRRRRF